MQEVSRLPSPFQEVDNRGCQGSSYSVPWVLFLLQLLSGQLPRLFKSWHLVGWPCLDEVMDGSDVLYDDLICRVDVALGMDIIDDIQ